ncbi:autophagy-related protein 22-1 [Zopfia rhizophila CBS 207.26]|uniref:Autophagy-related protein n=1 Tax=Zopfia rhizophila CBS 207.26 TaxID=1314779 RepID=A0A6A6E5L0_9PEZI|nr:autophagy-related protein 22-1 [Zopfia rhizophila CBS 207.26]
MSFDETVRLRLSAHYEGEDISVTTKQELNGWYSYAIAAEVYTVVGLAHENGVLWSDKATPCIVQSRSGVLTRTPTENKNGQCVVSLLGAEITTASFAMYTFSLAVLIQATTLICFSSFADHGPYRKKMLMAFAYIGSTASASFLFINPSIYFLAPLLVIIGVTCLGSSFTLLNAFLPLLVWNHQDATRNGRTSTDFELEALNPESSVRRHDPEKTSRDLQLSAKISSKGVGLGYTAAVFVQCISIVILFIFSKTSISKTNPSLPIRAILFLVGIWWATFTVPTLLWLRPRPGPPLSTQVTHQPKHSRTCFWYLSFSILRFWHTLKRALKLRQILLFLIAWFLLSDAIATVSGTAILFARTELKMGTIAVALLSITSIGFGIVGAFTWPRISTRYHLEPKTVLLLCVAGMEIVPLYGLLGYIPFLQRVKVGGLQQPWEIYPLGALHGFILGGISSYARSIYSGLVPRGSEAAFFALYAVTDKGSSAVGPAVVGLIVDRAGTIRPAFLFLAVLVLCPGPLVWILDMEKGREDATRMAEKKRGSWVEEGDEDEVFSIGDEWGSEIGKEEEWRERDEQLEERGEGSM